ncbi:hypothetical protein [Olene mendosa nucleopolyhedrovirus]|uniref:Uncharacterized protein n=1 Tax=Olene mendosa nucleopolyhedrovirus TaxID=2933796 RepID=A0AAX3AUR2_9ABAC|nr:hypothetical protein QKV28_gp145 [Olene mendosa nucleopolyhedrovirus]UOQ18928.1 hypothetical protein [Olene mendosa nucleopolyhedrovirus]
MERSHSSSDTGEHCYSLLDTKKRRKRSKRSRVLSSSSSTFSTPPFKVRRNELLVYQQKNDFDMVPDATFNKIANCLSLSDYLSLYQAYQRTSSSRITLVDGSDQFNINNYCYEMYRPVQH